MINGDENEIKYKLYNEEKQNLILIVKFLYFSYNK